MKKSQHSLAPKFSTSLSEGTLSRTPQLPSTTPSIGTNGRANPYATLLSPQITSTDDGSHDQQKKNHQLTNNTLPNSSMHAIYKMISKLPFEVRERVTSIVNMALFQADNSQKQYEALKLEHLTLKAQHKKKVTECDHLQQRCEIFHEQIVKLEEKLGALQDDAESRQTYAIRNSKAISRLSSTNKTLIDAFALLTDGHPPSTGGGGGNGNPDMLRGRSQNQRHTQRRKNNLLSDLTSTSRASSPEEFSTSQPNSPLPGLRHSHLKPSSAGAGVASVRASGGGIAGANANANVSATQEVSVTKNEKLRERLLRVAKDHNRVVKNVENLELKIQGLRSSLRYAERRNRQLQLELDEIRENQSLENSASVHKNQSDGHGGDNGVSSSGAGGAGNGSSGAGAARGSSGGGGGSKHLKDRMDTRLSVLVNRNAFDPMDGIKYMDSMIAHLSATPSTLLEEDIVRHLCSRAACNLFDVEKIAIFILQPGGKVMNRYVTNFSSPSLPSGPSFGSSSSHHRGTGGGIGPSYDQIKLGEEESIAENILFHGVIRRYNNLKQTKNLFYNPEIDSMGDSLHCKRILSVPLREMGPGGRVIGVCQLINKRENNKFSEVDELYVTAYGEMCGGLVSGSILFRRVWNESAIITGIIQASYQLLRAVPQRDTLCSIKPLELIDILFTLEHVIRDALKCSKVKAFLLLPKDSTSASTSGPSGATSSDASGAASRASGPSGVVYSLEQEAISMMTLKTSQLSLRSSSSHSGVMGHVITSMKPYLVLQSSFDPWLNPEVDMAAPAAASSSASASGLSSEQCVSLSPFYCVPIINFSNEVIGCLQLSPSSQSPHINSIQEKIEPLALSFEKAAEWLAFSLSGTLSNLLQAVGKPSARPEKIVLEPITLTEKLATMPLSCLQPTQPEAVRNTRRMSTSSSSSSSNSNKRKIIVKSVTMAEEGLTSHQGTLPGGGLYEHPPHHPLHSSNRGKDGSVIGKADEDLREFLLQFPDYEQHQQLQQAQGGGGGGGSRTNTTNQNRVLSSSPGGAGTGAGTGTGDGLDPLRTSPTSTSSKQPLISPLTSQQLEGGTGTSTSTSTSADPNTAAAAAAEREQREQSVRARHEKELASIKSELFFVKEKAKSDLLKLQNELKELRDHNSSHTATTPPVDTADTQQLQAMAAAEAKAAGAAVAAAAKEEREKYEKSLSEYQLQFEKDLQKIRSEQETEKSLYQRNISQLEELVQSLQKKLTFVDQPMGDPKDLDIVGHLEVSRIFVKGLHPTQQQSSGETSEAILQMKLGDGSIWSHLSTPSPVTNSSITPGRCVEWKEKQLQQFHGKISQAQLPIDTLSLRIKEKRTGGGQGSGVKLIGIGNVNLSTLLSQANRWVTLSGDLLTDKQTQSGKAAAEVEGGGGSYEIRIRYRREDQEPQEDTSLVEEEQLQREQQEKQPKQEKETSTTPAPVVTVAAVVPEERGLLETEEISREEEKQQQPQPLSEKQDQLEEAEQEAEPVGETETEPHAEAEEEAVDEIRAIGDDQQEEQEQEEYQQEHELAEEEERPPPTPSKEEVAGSPRFGPWAQMTDEEGHVFYFHTITGETSWNLPDEMNGGAAAAETEMGEVEGAGEVRNGDWLQLQDDGGNFYWYNEVTGESSWELPSEDPELYVLPMHQAVDSGGGAAYASASAGGYTIEL